MSKIGKIFKKFWWILLIVLLLIGGGIYVLKCGLPWAKQEPEVVEEAPADPFALDTTKDLDYNLDIIKRYLAEDEWALGRLQTYRDYLDPLAEGLTDEQRIVYDQLVANHHFRSRLNNGQWNTPEGECIIDLQYEQNLYDRTDLMLSMAAPESENRFAAFYTKYSAELPTMSFSAISDTWNEGDTIQQPDPEPKPVVAKEPKEPKEKPIIETPSQKLLKALRNYSPQCPEATIREQVELKRYPEYADMLGRLSRKVQKERNSTSTHRASHYEECLKGAEDFDDLIVRYGVE